MNGFGFGEQVISGSGGPLDGIKSFEDWNAFVKATQVSGYETDHNALTGSQALRVESLEGQLRKVVESEDTFKLFRSLRRTPVTSAVHEFNVQTDIGGQPAGAFNSEIGDIAADVGSYERRIVFVKYLATQAVISHVAAIQRGIVNLKAQENQNALLRLGRTANWSGYHGDASVSPMQFDGLYASLKSFRGGAHIQSLDGSQDVGEVMDGVYNAFATVIGQGNYGKLTHLMMDPLAQNAIDRDLDPAYRVNMDANPATITFGSPVSAIKTSYGNVQTEQDIWIENANNSAPAYARFNKVPDTAPGTPTFTATAAAGATGSKFTAGRNGAYYYVVCAVDERGVESIPATAASATVAVGGKVTIAITKNADNKQTGYAIYRSRQDPAAAPAVTEYRLVTRIAANTGDGSGTYEDLDARLPGASTLFLLNRVPESLDWVQLMPVTQWPLYATKSAIIPWAVLMYITLRVSIPNHHFILENFVPKQATWKPHN